MDRFRVDERQAHLSIHGYLIRGGFYNNFCSHRRRDGDVREQLVDGRRHIVILSRWHGPGAKEKPEALSSCVKRGGSTKSSRCTRAALRTALAVYLAYKAYQHLYSAPGDEAESGGARMSGSMAERLRQEVIAVERQGRGDGWTELARESGVIVYRKKVPQCGNPLPPLCHPCPDQD